MPAPTTDLSSNWKKLQAKLQAEKKPTDSSATKSTSSTTSNGIKRKRPIDKNSSTSKPPTRYIKAKLTGDNTSTLGKKRKMGSYMSSTTQAEPSTSKSHASLTTDHDIPAADLAA